MYSEFGTFLFCVIQRECGAYGLAYLLSDFFLLLNRLDLLVLFCVKQLHIEHTVRYE